MDKKIFINKIIKSIIEYKEGYYEVKNLNDFIFQIMTKEGKPKYLIFEPVEIYQKIDSLTEFLTILDKIEFETEDILRIPFFAGCSGYDIGYFITGNHITIDKKLNREISFEVLPADFNAYGLNRFLNYVDMLYDTHPIFKGNNNFSSYIEYFEKIIKEKDDKINMVLPLNFIKRSTKTPFLKAIIDSYEEVYFKKKGIRLQLRPTNEI